MSFFLSFLFYLFIQDNNKYSQGKENIELLPMPSTSQRNSNATAMLLSTENLDDDDDEADSFSTQRLFSFAWQIAKGMVKFKTVCNYG